MNVENLEVKPCTSCATAYQQFIRDRQILNNLSTGTIRWHSTAGKAALKYLPSTLDKLDSSALKTLVIKLVEHGHNPAGVNTITRSVNAWLNWLRKEQLISEQLRTPKLKEELRLPPSLSIEDFKKLLRLIPKGVNLKRAWLLSVLILDTGLRLGEALALTVGDINFDSQVVKVFGKGRKERIVPFSPSLRRLLWQALKGKPPAERVFRTRTGTVVTNSNAERDIRVLGKAAGLSGRLYAHLLRHTFATYYIRNGGDPARLQRILGHTTLQMTMRYVHLQTADLSAVHSAFSPLGRMTL